MKAKAFTLMEMLLVMALTGLAMGIAWGIYADFQLFGSEYDKRTSDAGALSLLHEYLSVDCRRAEQVTLSGDSLAMQGPRPALYVRMEAGLLRVEGETRDSFFLPLQRFSLEKGPRTSTLAMHLGTASAEGRAIHYSIHHPPSAIQP